MNNDKSGSKFLPDSYSGNAIHTVRYGVSWFTSFAEKGSSKTSQHTYTVSLQRETQRKAENVRKRENVGKYNEKPSPLPISRIKEQCQGSWYDADVLTLLSET
mmetsp:Transcript_26891/g.44306  ORF Transcript_26891/g.44306 Transcript_26891/m.44306 type:complete len:103 (+) Transcript_26891:1107-1415(+)